MAMPTLTHVQSGSARRAQVRNDENNENGTSAMPPPPLPASRLEQRPSMGPRRMPQPVSGPRLLTERSSFIPPATPQMTSSGGSQRFLPQTPSKASGMGLPPKPAPFVPGPHYAQRPAGQTQRFIPMGGNVQRLPGMASMSSSGSIAGSASIPQTPTRAGSLAPSGTLGGQRIPLFLPDDSVPR